MHSMKGNTTMSWEFGVVIIIGAPFSYVMFDIKQFSVAVSCGVRLL